MPSIDELLAHLLEEPDETLGYLADVVTRGKIQADDVPSGCLEILARYDLVMFLVQRAPRQPVRTWVYPSPLGLKMFALLEREAEQLEEPPRARSRTGRRARRGGHGVSR